MFGFAVITVDTRPRTVNCAEVTVLDNKNEGGSKTTFGADGVMKTVLGLEFNTEIVKEGDRIFTGREGISGML
jgi:hypothetical protein